MIMMMMLLLLLHLNDAVAVADDDCTPDTEPAMAHVNY